jgi:hypothetical protein
MGSHFPLTPAGVDYLPLLLRMKLVSRTNKLKAAGILRLPGGSVNTYFSSTYFETFRMRVVRGRNFTDQDSAGNVRVAMPHAQPGHRLQSLSENFPMEGADSTRVDFRRRAERAERAVGQERRA